jgi:hypothetical protein
MPSFICEDSYNENAHKVKVNHNKIGMRISVPKAIELTGKGTKLWNMS